MEKGLYLYCLARLSQLPDLPLKALGLNDEALEITDSQDVAAVWSQVPLRDFCGPGAAVRLQDLKWIGPRAVRHQEVVAEVMRHSPVLPSRFGTIFSSLGALEKVLSRRHGLIAAALERLAGQEEWAVKGWLNRAALKERFFSLKVSQVQAELEKLPPGKRYLAEQRLRAEGEQELPRWLKQVRLGLWDKLSAWTTEILERRLLQKKADRGGREMIFNWACLLPTAEVPGFQEEIAAANLEFVDSKLSLECSGPWPAYSFCPAVEAEAES